jgi:hypothetical protein
MPEPYVDWVIEVDSEGRDAWKQRNWWREAAYTALGVCVGIAALFLGVKMWFVAGNVLVTTLTLGALAFAVLVGLRVVVWCLNRKDPDPEPDLGRLERRREKADELIAMSVEHPYIAGTLAAIHGIDLESEISGRVIEGATAVAAGLGTVEAPRYVAGQCQSPARWRRRRYADSL